MALILNIETATDLCSVCIAKGTEILSIQEDSKAYSHASVITGLIEKSTKEAKISLSELDAVAVSSGPGSYTALRVGAATAKGICYALDKPLIAISTLEALAYASRADKPEGAFYIPMIDARRMEVYAIVYDSKMQEVEAMRNVILDKQSFSEHFGQGSPIVFCGNGAEKSKAVFESPLALFSEEVCSSRHLVSRSLDAFQQGQFNDIAYYTPQYFKAPNITVSKKTL